MNSALKDMVDDSTTHVTVATPPGWRCKRASCKTEYLHSHGTYTSLEKKYVFLRYNESMLVGEDPMRMTEAEVRTVIGASRKNVDGAIRSLKRGFKITTKYASYRAEEM